MRVLLYSIVGTFLTSRGTASQAASRADAQRCGMNTPHTDVSSHCVEDLCDEPWYKIRCASTCGCGRPSHIPSDGDSTAPLPDSFTPALVRDAPSESEITAVLDGGGTAITEIMVPQPNRAYCQNRVWIRCKFLETFPSGTSVTLMFVGMDGDADGFRPSLGQIWLAPRFRSAEASHHVHALQFRSAGPKRLMLMLTEEDRGGLRDASLRSSDEQAQIDFTVERCEQHPVPMHECNESTREIYACSDGLVVLDDISGQGIEQLHCDDSLLADNDACATQVVVEQARL